jgi:F-type H+/Na+-transporting ATPase subunit alpha
VPRMSDTLRHGADPGIEQKAPLPEGDGRLDESAVARAAKRLLDSLASLPSPDDIWEGSVQEEAAEELARGKGALPDLVGHGEPRDTEVPAGFLEKLRIRPWQSVQKMLRELSEQSRQARPGLSIKHVGTVRQVGDGVASVWGLPQARTDELLQFTGQVMGLVMNLDRDWIDCVLLGSDEGIKGGGLVWSTGQRVSVPVGERVLGRVVDPLGVPLDGKGRLFLDERRLVERQAPGVIERQPVSEPLQTGIKSIDAIIPIGRGQRELIIGDRQTGKTSIAVDTIINQRDQDVVCVYVSIGQRKSSVMQVIRALEEAGAMENTVVVMASPDDPPALVYLAPYSGCTIAEAFLDHGRDVLIVYDDLTKHADAYRELSLLLRRPPGREAYPGDIFYLHSRLLERAARLSDALGGGSITALPIVETRRGNISAYIPTNLISITDGQIYLSPELFNQGIRPAVDVGLSVSRVGGAAQSSIMRKVSGRLKLDLAQYEEVAHFARFGTEIDRTTRQQIARGVRLREALKQPAYAPLSLAQQILVLYAVSQGYMDEIELDQVGRFGDELWAYAQREYRAAIHSIEEQRDLTDGLRRELDALMARFSEIYS